MIDTVSIIVVNYNGYQDVMSLIRSILDNVKRPINIIVVDNKSEEINCTRMCIALMEIFPDVIHSNWVLDILGKNITVDQYHSKDYPNVKSLNLLKSPCNGGFAYGNNVGILFGLGQLKNEAFWLLNSDTIIEQSALEHLISTIGFNNKIGIVGSVLLEFDTPDTIQSAGGIYKKVLGINSDFLAGKRVCEAQDKRNSYENVDYPVGASMLVKKDFILDVGLMNEDFFLYFEELDWVTRGKKRGWEFRMAPGSLVWHKQGGTINTSNTRSKISDYFIFRARILYTYLYYWWFLPAVIISSTLAYVFNRLKRKQYDRLLFPFQFLINPKMSIQTTYKKATRSK